MRKSRDVQSSLFTDYERKILRKFKNGGRIEEKDSAVIDKLSSIGFVRQYYNWVQDYPVAKLNKVCIRYLNK